MDIEIADIVEAFNLNFLLGSVVYNICQCQDGIGDLDEALSFLKREIENQERAPAGEGPKRVETDNINPNHYKSAKFQVIDVIELHDLNFCLGNAVKYICRHANKNGLEDLKKALWYLNREIEKA